MTFSIYCIDQSLVYVPDVRRNRPVNTNRVPQRKIVYRHFSTISLKTETLLGKRELKIRICD